MFSWWCKRLMVLCFASACAVMSNGVKPPSGRKSLKAFQKVMLETTLSLERTFLTWARLAVSQSQPRKPW